MTRARECHSADFWHLNGNTLLWGNKSGRIQMYNLRSVQNAPSTQGWSFVRKLFGSLRLRPTLYGALLTEDGDLLIHVYIWSSSERSPKARANRYYFPYAGSISQLMVDIVTTLLR